MTKISRRKFPKGSKSIIDLFLKYQELSIEELIEMSNLSASSLRYAIRRLLEEDILISVSNLMDMRSKSYRINPSINSTGNFYSNNPEIARKLAEI